MRIIGIGLFTVLLAATGCAKDDSSEDPIGAAEGQSLETDGDSCGGITGALCADGLLCVDDPSDTCEPGRGGADCPGICQRPTIPPPEPIPCAGFLGTACPEKLVCIDDAFDSCDPAGDGADCPGHCVEIPAEPIACGGFGGFLCPYPLVCIDNPNDECGPPEGADCGGICVGP